MTDIGVASGVPSRVLVVEDDYVARTFTVRALLSHGISCDVAADGLEAEAKLRESSFDVVITDLRMPGKHGYALIRELVQVERRPVIIVYTSILEPRLACDLLERGVDDILFKPIESSLLAAKVVAVWRHRTRGHFADRRASDTRKLLPLDEAHAILRQTWPECIVPPAVVDIFRMSGESGANSRQIAQVLARDAKLLTAVLDLANNSFFNTTGKRVVREEQAITVLGRKRLGELVLGTQMLSQLTSRAPDWMDEETMTRQGLAATMMAHALIRDPRHDETSAGVMLGAMLATAGHVILAAAFADRYQAVIDECQSRRLSLVECERRHLSLCGPDAAAWMLAQHGVEPQVTAPLEYAGMQYSAFLDLPPDERSRASWIKASSILGKTVSGRWSDWDQLELPPVSVMAGWDSTTLERLICDVQQSSSEWRPAIRSHKQWVEPESTVGLPKSVPYFAVNEQTLDILPHVLASLGCSVTPCSRGDLRRYPSTLVNCHQPSSDLADLEGVGQWQGNLVALTDNGEQSRKVELPCSIGQVRALLQQMNQHARSRDPGMSIYQLSGSAN